MPHFVGFMSNIRRAFKYDHDYNDSQLDLDQILWETAYGYYEKCELCWVREAERQLDIFL